MNITSTTYSFGPTIECLGAYIKSQVTIVVEGDHDPEEAIKECRIRYFKMIAKEIKIAEVNDSDFGAFKKYVKKVLYNAKKEEKFQERQS